MNDIKEQLERLKNLPEEIRNELGNKQNNIQNQLIISNISKSYKKKNVLDNVSLELNRGEVIGLLGPNGAGKTTCFYIVAGLIKSDSGEILFDNEIPILSYVHIQSDNDNNSSLAMIGDNIRGAVAKNSKRFL